jgi:hypothetical protein
MPDRGVAEANCLGNLGDRHFPLDQRDQLVPGDATTRRTLRVVDRFESVLLDPIPDRRFVQAEMPADLRERQTITQQALKGSPIHTRIV